MQSTGNAFKKVTYDYDLISGKVNNVSYQPGEHDQFHHRYEYDAENRITKVHTSGDGVIWETDARYYYYRHGPLARTETGDLLVQGTDYAYTLQGWLKGVNSSALDPAHDMGEDGSSTSIVAKDVYGFALHYYSTDYAQINTAKTVFAPINTTVLTGFKPLFNGNIAAMSVNIGQFNRPLIYNYGYDQLNRLVAMDAYTGLNNTTNAWTPVSTDDYKERISYDGNGNILTYLRNGTTLNSRPQTMDELTYGYNLDGGGRLLDNRLRHVKDAVSSGNYTTDIDDQGDDNYAYDEIGNLISDDQEGISEISWNVYGKIGSISKSGPVTISYDYDASGNRIGKTVGNKHTWYVRDASGNVMAVYEDGNSSINSGALSQIEVHLYGNTRFGMWQANRNVVSPPQPVETALTGLVEGGITLCQERGEKIFELSNHLENVLVTISDRRVEHNTSGTTIDYYEASVVSATDYAPFGLVLEERKYSLESYRYGFNGHERSSEIHANSFTATYWEYDSRIGRRWNMDPKAVPWESVYAVNRNNPIWVTDFQGDFGDLSDKDKKKREKAQRKFDKKVTGPLRKLEAALQEQGLKDATVRKTVQAEADRLAAKYQNKRWLHWAVAKPDKENTSGEGYRSGTTGWYFKHYITIRAYQSPTEEHNLEGDRPNDGSMVTTGSLGTVLPGSTVEVQFNPLRVENALDVTTEEPSGAVSTIATTGGMISDPDNIRGEFKFRKRTQITTKNAGELKYRVENSDPNAQRDNWQLKIIVKKPPVLDPVPLVYRGTY